MDLGSPHSDLENGELTVFRLLQREWRPRKHLRVNDWKTQYLYFSCALWISTIFTVVVCFCELSWAHLVTVDNVDFCGFLALFFFFFKQKSQVQNVKTFIKKFLKILYLCRQSFLWNGNFRECLALYLSAWVEALNQIITMRLMVLLFKLFPLHPGLIGESVQLYPIVSDSGMIWALHTLEWIGSTVTDWRYLDASFMYYVNLGLDCIVSFLTRY